MKQAQLSTGPASGGLELGNDMHDMNTPSASSNVTVIAASPRARQIAAVVTLTMVTVISAKVAVPIPGTAVPFTFQTLAVLLAGALLGPRLGAASQFLYLTLGVVGIPVFFGPVAGPAYLLGPTGGYLLAYPFAAYLTGHFAGAGVLRTMAAMVLGLATIYAGGLSWLAIQSGWAAAVTAGLLPFVAADLVKVAMGVVIVARLRDRCRTIFGV